MLVRCQLANVTSGAQARPALKTLMKLYTIRELAAEDPEALHHILKPLGMWRRRALILTSMARAWMARRPRCRADVLRMPGCGRYAADSWSIFIERNHAIQPDDRKLKSYLAGLYESAE